MATTTLLPVINDEFLIPVTPKKSDGPIQHVRHLDLPSRRADHISVLLTIPSAREVLRALKVTI